MIGLESKDIFYHNFVLPVFEEQVRCHAPITLLQYKKLSIGAWLSVVDCRLIAKSKTLNFNIFKTIKWIVLKFHRAMFLTMLILISSFKKL